MFVVDDIASEIASIRTLGALYEVNYRGAISMAAFCVARPALMDATKTGKAIVARLDRVVLLITEPPPPLAVADYRAMPAAALVVPDWQIDLWRAYCLSMGGAGVMRVAFRASQSEMAYRWARAHQESPRLC